MGCEFISGMVGNILLAVGDESLTIYTSGKVEAMIFKDIPVLNGLMGSCFSGSGGCITPNMSGTIYQGVLESMVARDLVRKTMTSAASNYSLTSFTEGDSKVTIADNAKNLSELYKLLSAEFDKLVNQAKFTLASSSPNSIEGADSIVGPVNVNYRPNYYPGQH